MIECVAVERTGLAGFLRNHPHQGSIIANPKRKFIYMKPTKTAGTSILRGTIEKLCPNELVFSKKDENAFVTWMEQLTDEMLMDYYIFTVVRNPWDRFVSIASHFGRNIESLVETFEQECTADRNFMFHTLPQHIYAYNDDRRYVDAICRFESLQEDLNIVFDQLDLPRTPVPHVNASRHRSYARYYTNDLKQAVGAIYAEDVRRFGYDMQLGKVTKKVQRTHSPLQRLFRNKKK